MEMFKRYFADPRPNLRIDDYLSRKLKVMSYAAALCVVCLHFGRNIDTGTWLNAFLNDAIIRGCFFASVSLFFLFSGMLLVKNFDGSLSWWKSTVVKRAKTLLVPYLFWCVLYGVCSRVVDTPDQLLSLSFWLKCLGVSPHRVLPLYCHMWYVRNLMVLCLLSPLFILAVNYMAGQRSTMFIAATLFIIVSVVDFPLKDQTVMASLYFMVGMFLAFHSDLLKRRVPTWVFLVWIALLILRGVGRHVWGVPSPYLHWVVFIFTIVCVWAIYDFLYRFKSIQSILGWKFIADLTSTSFLLYCAHMWVVISLSPWPAFMDGWVVQPILQTVVIAGFVYIAYKLLIQRSAWLSRIMTGGR